MLEIGKNYKLISKPFNSSVVYSTIENQDIENDTVEFRFFTTDIIFLVLAIRPKTEYVEYKIIFDNQIYFLIVYNTSNEFKEIT